MRDRWSSRLSRAASLVAIAAAVVALTWALFVPPVMTASCIRALPQLFWPLVLADATIGVAYFLIPIWLYCLMPVWRAVNLAGEAWLFVAFIVCCGLGHFLDVHVLAAERPAYLMVTIERWCTAVISALCTVVIFAGLRGLRPILDATGEALLEYVASAHAIRRHTRETLQALELVGELLAKLQRASRAD